MSKNVSLLLFIPVFIIITDFFALHRLLYTPDRGEEKEEQKRLSPPPITEALTDLKSAARITTVTRNREKQKERKESKQIKPVAAMQPESAQGEQAQLLGLSKLFVDKLKQLVKKSTNGLYNLSVGNVALDVFSATVSLHHVSLHPDEQVLHRLKKAGMLPQAVLSISLDSLQIEGIDLKTVFNSDTLHYKLVKLANPVVEISHHQAGVVNSSGDFSQQLLKQVKELAIEKLQVENGTFTIHNQSAGNTKKLEHVRVLMKDILLNDDTRFDKDRVWFASDARIEFHDVNTTTNDGLYKLSIGEAVFNATEKRAELKDVYYGSLLSKEEFAASQKEAREKFDVRLPVVSITGVKWWPIIQGQEIVADEIITKGGQLADYFDRSRPPGNRKGNFPNQMLEKLSTKVDVKKVKVQDLDVLYEEYSPKSQQHGTIYLEDVNMTITNISNTDSLQKPIEIEGSALLMKEVPISVSLTFSMENAKQGAFTAKIKLDTFQVGVLNPMTKPLGMMLLESGRVYTLDVSMQGDQEGSTGEVLVLYENLSIALLEKNKNSKGLNKRRLVTFLANLFVIKNDNPWWLTGDKRIKQVDYERHPKRGFINLVWTTAFIGILKTIGAPKKMALSK